MPVGGRAASPAPSPPTRSPALLASHRVAAPLLPFPGIERYGESWQLVAEHVGGKSAMQCVARFLQLPTEEALLADAVPGPQNHGLVRGWRLCGLHEAKLGSVQACGKRLLAGCVTVQRVADAPPPSLLPQPRHPTPCPSHRRCPSPPPAALAGCLPRQRCCRRCCPLPTWPTRCWRRWEWWAGAAGGVEGLVMSERTSLPSGRLARSARKQLVQLTRTAAHRLRSAGILLCVQVSFLANMVGPKIAAAAAQRALEVLAEEDAAAAAAVSAEAAQPNGGAEGEANGAQIKQEGGSTNGSDAVRSGWAQLLPMRVVLENSCCWGNVLIVDLF